MALTQEDLQAIAAIVKAETGPINNRLDAIEEKQDVHTSSILNLENKVMHELKLLNENLPDAVARNERLKEVEAMADDHDHRIFALEQTAANG